MTAVRRIGIAVVQHRDSFLVGTRPAGVPLAGCAEFPGGKCEPEELPGACAIRECFEETGLATELQMHLGTIPWSYPHGNVELHFWLCRCSGVSQQSAPPDPRAPFRWIPRLELNRETFPPANSTILEQLVANQITPVSPPWQITVRFFAAAREAAGTDARSLPVEPNALLGCVQTSLLQQHPELRRFASSLLWAVDNQYADAAAPLRDGAVVACFPPVSGG